MLVSSHARAERFPWPVHLDEFRLAGRVRRQGRPDIWIYDHHENRGSVCVDATGQTYKFVATPRAKGVGQFRRCSVRTALWRARLPDVVAPVRYDPPGPAWHPAAWPGGGAALPDDARPGAAGPAGEPALDLDLDEEDDEVGAGDDEGRDVPRTITRGHLTLVAG